MTKRYLAVGLLVVADLKKAGRVAVLQRRGGYNYELQKPMNFPGYCQVTAQGRNKKGEGIWDTLQREIGEEVGENFLRSVFRGLTKESFNQKLALLVKLGDHQFQVRDEEVMAIIFGKKVSQKQLALIRLEPSSGGLVYVTEKDLPRLKTVAPGKIRTGDISVFTDCLLAIKAAFKIFGKKKSPRPQ